jgi:hypothetical protein
MLNKTNYITLLNDMTGGAKRKARSRSRSRTKKKLVRSTPKPFELIVLDLTDDEIKQNQNLEIENHKTYEYYGKVNALDYSDIENYIEKIGNNDEETIKSIYNSIQKIIKQFMEHYNNKYRSVDSVWISIRPTNPRDDFKIPRWHRDGKYFTTEEGEKAYKFVTCLKGPTTLFVTDNEVIAKYREVSEEETKKKRKLTFDSFEEQIKYTDENVRPLLADVIGNDYESVPDNHGLIFLVGDPNYGVIHSEPDKNVDRLFMSILPGSEEQIREWKK